VCLRVCVCVRARVCVKETASRLHTLKEIVPIFKTEFELYLLILFSEMDKRHVSFHNMHIINRQTQLEANLQISLSKNQAFAAIVHERKPLFPVR
jgi:hypothetical protein